MQKNNRTDRPFIRLTTHRVIPALLGGSGIIILILSFAEFQSVRSWLDRMAVDGSADVFDISYYGLLVSRLRIVGLTTVLCGAIAFYWREPVYRLVSDYLGQLGGELAGMVDKIGWEIREISPGIKLALLFLVLAGAWIRWKFLAIPIRYDEAYTYINYASRNPLVALSLYDAPNNHILHSLLVNGATSLFGPGEAVIRLPAFTASILLIPSAFILCRMLFGNYTSGLIGAALSAVSCYMIEYGINARGYSLVCLFAVLLLIATDSVIKNPRSPFWWTIYALSAVAGMATVPTMAYPISISVVWYVLHAINVRNYGFVKSLRPLAFSLVSIILLTFLWYLPAIAVSGTSTFIKSGSGDLGWIKWLHSLGSQAGKVAGAVHYGFNMWVLVLLICGFIAGIIKRPLLATGLIAVPVLIAAQQVVPFVRVFSFLILIYYLIAAGGISWIIETLRPAPSKLERRLIPAAVVILSFTAVMMIARSGIIPDYDKTFSFPEGPRVAKFLKGKINENRPVLTDVPCDSPLIYYGNVFGLKYQHILSSGILKGNIEGFWLVTNDRSWMSTKDRIYRVSGLSERPFAKPILVADFGKVKIFRVDRDTAAPRSG